jgi:hypothetical protein
MDKSTPATKKDLQQSDVGIKNELRGEIAQMKTCFVDRLMEVVRDVETSLLTAFRA